MSDVVITVRGEHEARVPPERAVVHLSIVTDGADRGAVVERVAALAQPIRDDLTARKSAGGVAEWTSERASVWSSRPWNEQGVQLPLVHQASVSLTVTFTDFAALSWWAGEVVERDGVQLGGIDWQLTPATRAAVEKQVATDAVAVAVSRAEAYATALGLTTITPIEVSDLGLLSPTPQAPKLAYVAMRSGAAGQQEVMEFRPDEIVVSSGVEARFTAR